MPRWLNTRNVKAAIIGVAVLFLLSAAVAEAKSDRLWTNLWGLGILCVLGLALWLVAQLVAALKARSQRFPPALGALMAVLGHLISFAATAAAGTYLYARWKNGDDLLGAAISFGVFAVVHFLDEWEQRSNNKSPAFGSEGTSH